MRSTSLLDASGTIGAIIAALAMQGHKRRAYGPLVLGIIGSTLLVVGKFQFDSKFALYSGVVLIIGASAWNAWRRKTVTVCDLPGKTTACPYGD